MPIQIAFHRRVESSGNLDLCNIGVVGAKLVHGWSQPHPDAL